MDIKIKAEADHRNEDFSIYSMVLNRLPFISDDEANKKLISNYVLETMHSVERCFKVGVDNIGVESFYDIVKQSILADITSMHILMVTAMEAVGGNASNSSEPLSTYLSKAKAGSVEVEFSTFNLKEDATFAVTPSAMYAFFKSNANSKLTELGCDFVISDEGSISHIVDSHIEKPFIIVSDLNVE